MTDLINDRRRKSARGVMHEHDVNDIRVGEPTDAPAPPRHDEVRSAPPTTTSARSPSSRRQRIT